MDDKQIKYLVPDDMSDTEIKNIIDPCIGSHVTEIAISKK